MSDTAVSSKPEGYIFGRPTKYIPKMCDLVVEWGKLGKSRAWICSRLDITPQTMANWEKVHPDFFEAMTRSRMHAQAHWEDQGQSNLLTVGFQSSVWSRSMGARFPDDWRESTKQETEVKGNMSFSIVSGVPRNEADD